MTLGGASGSLLLQRCWDEVRYAIALLAWLAFAGLVTAAGCWCFGHVVRCDALRIGPPVRRRRVAADPGPAEGAAADFDPDGVVAEEALRGIREIEEYLSRV